MKQGQTYMKNRRIRLLVSVAVNSCLLLWLLGSASADSPDPKSTVEALLGAVETLSKGDKDNPDPAVTRRISQIIDIAGVSQSCLLDTWQKLPKSEQENFLSLFRQVLEEVAYPNSAKFFKSTKVEIEQVKVDGDRAEVETVVTHPEEGMVEVGYRLKLLDKQWLLEDVLLDGVSLVTDLRSQMQKILREQSYEELKRRMREKLG